MKVPTPVPPEETGSAVVKLAEAAESAPPIAAVPVAVRFAREILPLKSPLPCTESACVGEVVPMPTEPPLVAKYAEPVEPI